MTWIKTIPPGQADPELKALYESLYRNCPVEYAAAVPVLAGEGCNDSIIESHSLIPELMNGIFTGFNGLFATELPLSRRQHEMIATVVSTLNRCHY